MHAWPGCPCPPTLRWCFLVRLPLTPATAATLCFCGRQPRRGGWDGRLPTPAAAGSTQTGSSRAANGPAPRGRPSLHCRGNMHAGCPRHTAMPGTAWQQAWQPAHHCHALAFLDLPSLLLLCLLPALLLAAEQSGTGGSRSRVGGAVGWSWPGWPAGQRAAGARARIKCHAQPWLTPVEAAVH